MLNLFDFSETLAAQLQRDGLHADESKAFGNNHRSKRLCCVRHAMHKPSDWRS